MMEKPKVSVEGFSMVWPHLTKQEQEKNPLMYQYAVNCIKSKKALEGFRAMRICKANSKGTKITFKRMRTATEMYEYTRELNDECDCIVNQIPELKAAVDAARREQLKQEIIADGGNHCMEEWEEIAWI